MKMWQVNAFATSAFMGNPAAVFWVDEFPESSVCMQITQELKLSESAFVRQLPSGELHLRWFAPLCEVSLCGHGTLAAAHVLYQEGYVVEGNSLVFETLSGRLNVAKSPEGYTLDFPLKRVSSSQEGLLQECGLTSVVNVARSEETVLVELKSEQAVRDLIPCRHSLMQLPGSGVIVTARGTGSYDIVSRFFAPKKGVDEDPVTGAAHCVLAGYWCDKLGKNTLHAYQASARGGEMQVALKGERVYLTGQAVTLIKGEWLV